MLESLDVVLGELVGCWLRSSSSLAMCPAILFTTAPRPFPPFFLPLFRPRRVGMVSGLRRSSPSGRLNSCAVCRTNLPVGHLTDSRICVSYGKPSQRCREPGIQLLLRMLSIVVPVNPTVEMPDRSLSTSLSRRLKKVRVVGARIPQRNLLLHDGDPSAQSQASSNSVCRMYRYCRRPR